MKKDQTKGFIGAAKQSDMLIQGFLGATSGLTGNEQPTDIGNDFTKNSTDSIRKGTTYIYLLGLGKKNSFTIFIFVTHSLL